MVELGFAISILTLSLYVKIRKIKPTDGYYIGTKDGFVDRAKQVTYYSALNAISTILFPIIIALISLTSLNKKLIINNNIWILLMLILSINLITMVISKIYSIIAVKIAIKEDKLQKYVGDMWIDTSV